MIRTKGCISPDAPSELSHSLCFVQNQHVINVLLWKYHCYIYTDISQGIPNAIFFIKATNRIAWNKLNVRRRLWLCYVMLYEHSHNLLLSMFVLDVTNHNESQYGWQRAKFWRMIISKSKGKCGPTAETPDHVYSL